MSEKQGTVATSGDGQAFPQTRAELACPLSPPPGPPLDCPRVSLHGVLVLDRGDVLPLSLD